ncbi:MAG: GNAT family N-acetyltransferase [Gammaproteobacteria bacterium]|nr:GNAT family N-acetyltransferase [Gammaproteobacteria bacterium]
MVDGFEVEITHGYKVEELQQQWLAIQEGQNLPFFLTWSWISCWLKSYTPELIIVSAWHKKQIVAIGLFTCSTQIRHGFVKSRQYRLHQMGDSLLDQIWMEYNDFICVEKFRVAAVNACLKALQKSNENWNEIILSMITRSRADQILSDIRNSRVSLVSPCYSKNLACIQGENPQYIDTLSSNTRYQIRRSIRLFEELHGPIQYEFAKDVDEAIAFFHEAGKYHVLRWESSGFNNKEFVLFHENLIKSSKENNAVDLMKISSGEVTIAILYFHIVDGDVYFYLQGINYAFNGQLKPGLVAHTMAAQYYLDKGMRKYDFMGGYSQYKCQLSDPVEDLVILSVQKPSVVFAIEKMCQKIKCLVTNVRDTVVKK